MHLKLGDTITLNVLGREMTGTIANLRKVDFSNGRQNFILMLSPGIIDHAPHSFLATVRVPDKDEEAVYRAVTNRLSQCLDGARERGHRRRSTACCSNWPMACARPAS